jgi:hypothetical protein
VRGHVLGKFREAALVEVAELLEILRISMKTCNTLSKEQRQEVSD